MASDRMQTTKTMVPPDPPADGHDLTVITTHMNADFDALASLLAAQKLYPDALVIFPGSQEKNLRDFFITSMVYLFNMADLKSISLEAITRLVLVDTRQPNRIGKLAQVLDKPSLDIHLYDHHPDMSNDIRGQYEMVVPLGATVTILTEIIRQKKIPITSEEATVMCLGIYEDTGSFTFSSTTPRDFEAAAYLLSRGANINSIASLISREISPDQVGVLNDMIQAATTYTINGIDIVLTAVSTDHYVPDFAFLVHKMIRMENLDAIFAVARMGSKIYVVGRSRIPEVDTGTILASLGGGGHTFAASATVRDETLAQTEQRLIELLYEHIRSRRKARDLMSSPAIMVAPKVTCKEAADIMTRYSVNALLVVDKSDHQQSLVGFITRQVIEKALYHHLSRVAVKEYTTTDLAAVHPDAELAEIQEKIIANKQRILPVLDGSAVVGVVTRTDLLNILVRQNRESDLNSTATDVLREPPNARTRNVNKFMRERLSKRIMAILENIGRVAAEMDYSAYVVGGFVRDLFLYRPNEDIDIVIEGDGIAFAKRYAQLAGVRIHTHQKFGTAVIIFPDGFKIDVASARMEYYKFPAALPTVEMSSIKLDLFRRDFTINTLAIQLTPRRFGILIDFFAAQKDIKEKVIRILHNLSFVEDPTRVFRAIRFEQRFGFTIGKLTSGLIENAVRMDFFKRLSGRRVMTELRLILSEDNPTDALVRMSGYDLLKVVHPALKMDNSLILFFNSVRKVMAWHDLLFTEESYMKWAVYYLALIHQGDRDTSVQICERLELAPRYQKIFCRERFDADRCLFWLERHVPVKNGTLYRRLCGFRAELILYMMAATRQERVKKAISHYYTRLRTVKPRVAGKDLLKLGIAPGPIYREILEAVQDAQLNGRLKSRQDELEFVKKYVR